MDERKQEIEKEEGKAHRIGSAREAPIGDGRRRPDEEVHRREDAKAQASAALHAVAVLIEIADIVGDLLFLLQERIQAHAVEIAHLHDADDIGIGLARLPVGDRLTADEERLRRLFLREPRLCPRRFEFFKEFHVPPPLPYHSAKKAACPANTLGIARNALSKCFDKGSPPQRRSVLKGGTHPFVLFPKKREQNA